MSEKESETKQKSKGPNIVLPFNLQDISKEDGKIIAFIWLLPCALVWPLQRLRVVLGLPRRGLLDDIPSLEPFFIVWLFFGWMIPALYFKRKRKHDKK